MSPVFLMAEQLRKILVVDDEPNMLHMLHAVLTQDGFEPTCAESALRALELVDEEEFDFVLSDVRMPGMDGIQLVENLRARRVEAIVILMSAYGSIDLALEAIRKGAYDYISKPFKTDEVVLTLRKASERERLRREVVMLKRRLLRTERNTTIIAKSKGMHAILESGRQVAGFDSPVLITGESGTGKELMAREIHARSQIAQGPFIAINCGAIPRDLLETELFGHAKGAFTGASVAKPGLFEEAHGGTLFLDEIGSMDISLQVKILRAVDTGEVRRVGQNSSRQVKVRILAATNEDLAAAIERGAFRGDLYYRLNVFQLHIPPLRERREDVIPLVEHFITVFNAKLGLAVKRITREAKEALTRHTWKGNVRELQNVIERAMILTETDSITLESLPHDIRDAFSSCAQSHEAEETLSLKKASKLLEKDLIVRALDRTGGNRSQAALLLEISYPSLLQRIKDYGIR